MVCFNLFWNPPTYLICSLLEFVTNFPFRTKFNNRNASSILIASKLSSSDIFCKAFFYISNSPTYEITELRYEKGNTELIKLTIDQFDLVRALHNFNLDGKALLSFITSFNMKQLRVMLKIPIG